MSNKQNDDGMRNVRIVLHEIYPEETFSQDGTGSKTNLNGIAWREKWVEAAKDTIINKSIRVEFLNDERSEMHGHGFTGYGADSIPRFEDATVIGHFTGSEIQDIEFEDKTIRKCLVGIGVIDAMCYPNLAEKLESGYLNDEKIHGSVEIMKDKDHDAIVYENGYHIESRTPQHYIYGGYAILEIQEADSSAVLLEINENKEDTKQMTEKEIKALVALTISELNNQTAEIEKAKEDAVAAIAEANAARDAAIAEKNELEASSQQIQAVLDKAQEELQESFKKTQGLYEEIDALREELGKAKARERVGELNEALNGFSNEEKAYAQAEIDAFNADPVASEINSVVSKIYEGIGKSAKADAEKVVSEQNSATENIEDIFGEVNLVSSADDIDIFN